MQLAQVQRTIVLVNYARGINNMVTLDKGQRVSLTKDHPGLKHVQICLGWDTNMYDGDDFDLDASVFLLTDIGKVNNENDFIFYYNKQHPTGAVIHMGDNRTGSGDGDDEVINIDFTKLPEYCTQIAVVVTIYEAEKRSQNFGMVDNAYIRLVDSNTKEEILRYDLSDSEDTSLSTAVEFSRLYQKDGEWKFKAVGQGFSGGLKIMCNKFGVDTKE